MADTPFIGPSYSLVSKPASVQRTINMQPVPIEPGNERAGWVFKDVHGLVELGIVVPPIYYTSWPYALFADEAFNAGLTVPRSGNLWVPPLEMFNADLSTPVDGTLTSTLHTYPDWPPETFNDDHATPVSGTLVVALNLYSNWPPETFNADLSTPLAGTLLVELVLYNNWVYESFNADLSIPLSGTCA